jgi:1,4-alpha-glucan branching enzyme
MLNSVEFRLLAPHAEAVTLKGSFLDWNEIPLHKDDKGYFRTSVDLEDGSYPYQFRVQSKDNSEEAERWVDINDPYVTEFDANGNGVVRIKDGERIVDDHVWQHDDKPLPNNDELIIYELLVSDFFHGNDDRHQGRYIGVIEKLDYLCELGINAIELLPLNQSPGDYNWGYIPSYFFAPQPNYGSTKELKQLIDECHARGIRVIVDQLYNHSSDESPLLAIDRDYWYYHDRHHPDADPRDHWGPEFNYEFRDEALGTRPAWDLMGDVMRFWVQEYHIDGVRYDALKELDNFDFLYWITQEAQRTAGSKPFYHVGEHIPENPDLIDPNGPMDGCWHESFYRTMQSHLSGESFDLNSLKQAIDPTQQGYPNGVTKAVNYLCNHDQKRLLLDLGDRGILDDAAFGRAKLGVALLMTAVGVPLIWMGEEFGDSTLINADEKDQQLGWGLLKGDRNQDLFEYYKSLISLRKQNPALQSANVEFFHENPEAKVLAYIRWNEEGARVVVIANFSDQVLAGYSISQFPKNGTWREWSNRYTLEAQNNQLTLDLGEYEAQVFVFESN